MDNTSLIHFAGNKLLGSTCNLCQQVFLAQCAEMQAIIVAGGVISFDIIFKVF